MSVYEFAGPCPDPRGANLREMHIVDDGEALLFELETIPQYTMEDPDSLVMKAVQNVTTSLWEWITRCGSAQDKYKELMTMISTGKAAKTMRIKFLLPHVVTADLLNPGSSDGILGVDYNLITYNIELKGKPLKLPVLKLAWHAAIASSIKDITKEDGIKDITDGVTSMISAPSRPTPSKSKT